MMIVLIDRFSAMLQSVIQEPGFWNVRYIDVGHTLSNQPSDYKACWANELHPTGETLLGRRDRFLEVAQKFQDVLVTLP